MPDSFRTLHRPGGPFILANAWDAGSAKMLEALGAPAIATSSAAPAMFGKGVFTTLLQAMSGTAVDDLLTG